MNRPSVAAAFAASLLFAGMSQGIARDLPWDEPAHTKDANRVAELRLLGLELPSLHDQPSATAGLRDHLHFMELASVDGLLGRSVAIEITPPQPLIAIADNVPPPVASGPVPEVALARGRIVEDGMLGDGLDDERLQAYLPYARQLGVAGVIVGGWSFDTGCTTTACPADLGAVATTGTFTFGTGTLGMDDFAFTALSGLTAGTYKLITSGGISGTLDSAKLTGTLGGFNATLSLNGNDIELTLTATFATWQSLNGTSGSIIADHDNDGVPDGIEYFLGGTSNTTGQTVLPGITNTSGTLSITWTKAATYLGVHGTDFVIETSTTLTGSWTIETVGVNLTITGNNVTYTFPASGDRRFVRLKVMSQ
jgi:hypothetical protein